MPHSSLYGRREEAEMLEVSKTCVLPAAFATILRLPSGARDWGSLEMLHEESSQTALRAYRFDELDAVHWMFMPTGSGSWHWEAMASDAQFFYYGEKRSGHRYVIACAVTFLEIDGVSLLGNYSLANCWSWSDDPAANGTDSVPNQSGLQKLSGYLGRQLRSALAD